MLLTLGAHAQAGLWSVCLSVYLSSASLLQGHKNAAILLKRSTAFERYGVKTSEKANMHNKSVYAPLVPVVRKRIIIIKN